MPDFSIRSFSFLRILRIVIGVSFIGEAIAHKQWLFLFLGGFLLYQGVMNVGCTSCVNDVCEVSEKTTLPDKP